MPLGEMRGVGPGNTVDADRQAVRASRSAPMLLGRVLDGLGRPIDGGGPLEGGAMRSTAARPPAPLGRSRDQRAARPRRARARHARALRLAASASASSPAPASASRRCSGMIARSTDADVNVICLVGERGREVREFVERDLGEGARALGRRRRHLRRAGARAHQGRLRRHRDRRVLPRPGRRRAADDGLGHALRDGAARGRPRDRRAAGDARLHAVSVFALLPQLLERAGTSGARLDHRPVHGAGRGRRHERARRRRGPRHARRPHRAHRASWRTATTTRRSTCSSPSRALPATCSSADVREAAARAARVARHLPRQGGPDHPRRLPARRRRRASTPRSSCSPRSRASCARASKSPRTPPTPTASCSS